MVKFMSPHLPSHSLYSWLLDSANQSECPPKKYPSNAALLSIPTTPNFLSDMSHTWQFESLGGMCGSSVGTFLWCWLWYFLLIESTVCSDYFWLWWVNTLSHFPLPMGSISSINLKEVYLSSNMVPSLPNQKTGSRCNDMFVTIVGTDTGRIKAGGT